MARPRTPPFQPLSVRLLAEDDGKPRVRGFDPITGQATLINPETKAVEPYPFAGLEIHGDTPARTIVPMSWVQRGVSEGWLGLEGQDVGHAPGGPDDDPWRVTHTFLTAETVVIHTTDGPLRYKVLESPGKYDDASEESGKRVSWAFQLELEA